ncbi:trypsin-like serine protease [Vibrio sp.]|nr:trypsin-like serine protease [Vibrio sp.]
MLPISRFRCKYTKVLPFYCLIALFSSAVHSDNISVTPYIVNGNDATVSDYGDFTSLFYDRINYDGVYGTGAFCGATALNSQYILTAAHCLHDGSGNLDDYALFTSVVPNLQTETSWPNGISEKQTVSEIYIHPDYDDSSSTLWQNDIAILKLDAPLSGTNSIQRPINESYQNSSNTFMTIGHGNNTSGVDSEIELQEVMLGYVSEASCQSIWSRITDLQICFSGTYDNTSTLYDSTCQGDSGGPVYWDEYGDGSSYIQVGITSFGPSTCGTAVGSADVTSVFTEVYDYEAWIDAVLNGVTPASYTVTEVAKYACINNSSNCTIDYGNGSSSFLVEESESDDDESSSGGGSMGWGTLLLLVGFRWIRNATVT